MDDEPTTTEKRPLTVADRLREAAEFFENEARYQRGDLLREYQNGKAFAYRHAARMIEGTDAS